MTALGLAQGGLLDDLGINPWVVLMQGAIFFITFLVLKRLLFGRIMDHMTGREAEAARAEEKIRHERAEGERLSMEYEGHIARIDKEAYERLQAILKEAIETRSRITAEAQAKASEETRAALALLAKERQTVLEALRKEVPAMTRQVVERVIGVPFESGALEGAAKGGGR
jgi:F0F1-type ATP synthase membrane subunit b/b'